MRGSTAHWSMLISRFLKKTARYYRPVTRALSAMIPTSLNAKRLKGFDSPTVSMTILLPIIYLFRAFVCSLIFRYMRELYFIVILISFFIIIFVNYNFYELF
jgi:hypothetical protein